MSEFKVGNEIRVVRTTPFCMSALEVGDTAIIDELYFNRDAGFSTSARMLCDKNVSSCFHSLENIELVKQDWTIYNNTLPWAELSDEQKGKMLLADHNGKSFGGTHKTVFNNPCHPYQAKPEPTMAELFLADWGDIAGVEMDGYFNFAGKIIAKGWVKKC
jgi:hypothetical protein